MKKRLMVLAGAFLLGLSVYSQSGEKIVKAKLGDYSLTIRHLIPQLPTAVG